MKEYANAVTGFVKKRRRLSIVIAIALILGLYLLLNGGPVQDANGKPAPTARVVNVEVAKVEPVRLDDVLTLPGQTEALHDVLISSERAGRVEWIGFEEGQKVTIGDIIIKIDLDQANADLAKAQAAYELARKQAERRNELLAQEVLSKEEMDKANTELQTARSNLSQAQVSHDQGLIASPIAGRINELMVDPGEYVNPGAAVVELVDISQIKIEVNVPELDVRYLEVGQQVAVTVDAYADELWTAVVDFVAFKADEATKTFRVRVVTDNADSRIRPGILARVSLQRRVVEDAVTAPLFAIVDKGGERVVFVEENGIARARTVELGVVSDDRIQVLSGLNVGDNLILAGYNEVEEGVAVRTQFDRAREATDQ